MRLHSTKRFSLKQQCCPHCGRRGTLNRHSRLLGNDPDHVDAQRRHGQRAFCSDRGRRGGCGRTFAIFFADVLPRHSVTATLLARLLAGLLTGAALRSVAEVLRTPFALETFYRLRQRLRRRLDPVRVCLCQEQRPPVGTHPEPLLQTVAHLQSVFPGAGNIVAAFQQRFQRPFLG